MNTWNDILAAFNDITRDSGNYEWSLAQKVRYANRALREICEACKYVDENEVMNVVSGTGTYSVTAAGYDVFRVEYDDQALLPITRDTLRDHDETYHTLSGQPRFYYLDEIYSTQDALAVSLYYVPGTSVTNGLRVWYHAYPTALTTSSTTEELEIPDWAVGAVLFYMLSIAFRAETRRKNIQTAAFYRMMYEDILDSLISRTNRRDEKPWSAGTCPRATAGYLSRLPDSIQAGPGAPGNFGALPDNATSATATVAEVQNGDIELVWDEPSGYASTAVQYVIWRGTDVNDLDEYERLGAGVWQGSDGYSDTAISAAGVYYYAVYAESIESGYLGERSRIFTLTVTA